MQKLYCYVDETGQDTGGGLFIVSVIVTGEEREKLVQILERIEQQSGKGKVKWMEARHKSRFAYIKEVLSTPAFKNTLHFSAYKNTKSYMALTVLSTARAILTSPLPHSSNMVYVDGLPKARLRWFGTELRRLSVHNSKVAGVRREEANTLMRLADACCGFVRAALSGEQHETAKLFEKAKKAEYIKEI